jgi:hypothetical protein
MGTMKEIGESTAMSASTNFGNDVATLREDVAALQRDVGALIGQLRSGTARGAQSLADQSLMAVLIAAGVGYIGGRLLSR